MVGREGGGGGSDGTGETCAQVGMSRSNKGGQGEGTKEGQFQPGPGESIEILVASSS